MTGVAGYANNTLSFRNATAGVLVDLLAHDAFVGSTAAHAWTGPGKLEDSIQNVPNVVGSKYGDVIHADNGVDRLTGGAGADQLVAGKGASSHDTFVYAGLADSNIPHGHDTIFGFKAGVDKIDVSTMNVSAANLLIVNHGLSNTAYVEQKPGVFNANTNLALVVNTAVAGGLHASDFVF